MAARKIAVTGGIGSGKTTVCEMLEKRGFPVFSCDAVYRELLSDEAFLLGLEAAVGVPLLREGKTLLPDRGKIASVVFSDAEMRARLENFTHPAILGALQKKMEEAEGDVVFAEVPLLFEGHYEGLFDGVIVVARRRESRLEAVRRRDRLTDDEIFSRMKNQIDYENFPLDGHTILYNDSDLESLEREVGAVIEKIVAR